MTARPRGRHGMRPQIEVITRSTRWKRQPKASAIVKSAIFAAANALSTPPAELAIVLCNDSAIKTLNRDWRGKNAATNVLSFPAAMPGNKRHASPYIGDIVIAFETTAREALAEGKPFRLHLAHLAVHGFLHLLGYDHETERDAQEMERLERRIMAAMAIPDPYASRDAEA